MLDPIGQAAIQSLAVDIANLTSRLAVAQASLNQILTIGNQINPGIWGNKRVEVPPRSTDPTAIPEYRMVAEVPQEEAEAVQRLLAVLHDLQSEV